MTNYRETIIRGLEALERAEAWLARMDYAPLSSSSKVGIKRSSDWHDVDRWPDMRLPATYNAINALVLLSGELDERAKQNAGTFISGFQTEDGSFWMPQLSADSVYKHPDHRRTVEYIQLHLANYARQALSWTRPDLMREPRFLPYLRDADKLGAWIRERNWKDPWMEGNVLVNVGGLLFDLGNESRILDIIDRLNSIQNPETGFWGEAQQTSRKRLLHAMAGSMHVFHLYYRLDVEVPRGNKIVDVGLDLAARELSGPSAACLDVDIVEMLAAMWPAAYRREEIRKVMAAKVKDVLRMQNEDGGFCDEREGIRRFDGWVGGYWEPQGISNCFATWFRSTTLAIALSVLDASLLERWTFRDRIGIGYFNPRRLQET